MYGAPVSPGIGVTTPPCMSTMWGFVEAATDQPVPARGDRKGAGEIDRDRGAGRDRPVPASVEERAVVGEHEEVAQQARVARHAWRDRLGGERGVGETGRRGHVPVDASRELLAARFEEQAAVRRANDRRARDVAEARRKVVRTAWMDEGVLPRVAVRAQRAEQESPPGNEKSRLSVAAQPAPSSVHPPRSCRAGEGIRPRAGPRLSRGICDPV